MSWEIGATEGWEHFVQLNSLTRIDSLTMITMLGFCRVVSVPDVNGGFCV
jgi:hypothetical protein